MRPVIFITGLLASLVAAAPLVSDSTVATPKRQLLTDVTNILNSVESSLAGLNTEISALVTDLTTGDVVGVLEDAKNDLAGDISLVESILADVGVGLDLSGVEGTVDAAINVVETLYNQVEALEADASVTALAGDVETLISTLLTDLKNLL